MAVFGTAPRVMGKMRLELMTSGTTNQRSNQLSYIPRYTVLLTNFLFKVKINFKCHRFSFQKKDLRILDTGRKLLAIDPA